MSRTLKSLGQFLSLPHPWFMLLGWLSAAAIVGLSVMPASGRPMTGASFALEHLAAFSIAGALFGVGYAVSSAKLAGCAVVGCVLIELIQTFVPTRHARLSDLLLNIAASLAAIGLVALLRRLSTDGNSGPEYNGRRG